LNVALVRVFKLRARWSFPYSKSYGGCRSWVNLPEPPEGWRESLVPAVSDEAFARTQEAVRLLLARPEGG
ncbi:MAG: hypothetical protein JWO94_289, partial [Verrucomicrobiaceae bacterium]|nr:hypothetical protein [Verrucomicrobiaceae bacterium]